MNWRLVATMVFVSILAVLDTTAVVVALPYMQGSLDADPTEISWVVTMFVVAEAIAIGLTGHLSRTLGRKRLALISVGGFVMTSVLCSAAPDLSWMIIARFLQGLFAGPLIPIAHATLMTDVPAEVRVKALGYWLCGILLGPALGPALGGFLVSEASWHWIFLINVPLGALALVTSARYIPPSITARRATDWTGLALLVAMVVSLQIVFDRGDLLGWFYSREIVVLTVFGSTAMLAFIWRGIVVHRRHIMNLHLLRNRHLAIGTMLTCVSGALYLGFMILLPSITIQTLQWDVSVAGLAIGCIGAVGFFGGLLGPRLLLRFGARLALMISFSIVSIGFLTLSQVTANSSPPELILLGAPILFGVMLGSPCITATALSGVHPLNRDEASSIFNGIKMLGFSLGASLITTLLYNNLHTNLAVMGMDVSRSSPGFVPYMETCERFLGFATGGDLLISFVSRSAALTSISQTAQAMAAFALLGLPLAALIGRKRTTAQLPPTPPEPLPSRV